MEEAQNTVVENRKKVEKMLYVMHAGRFVFAYMFIVSAWEEFHEIYLDGGLVAEELLKLSLYQYIVRLGIGMRIFGAILFIFNTYFGALLLLIYQAILSPILYDLSIRRLIRLQQKTPPYLPSLQRLCERSSIIRKSCDGMIRSLSKLLNETGIADDGEATCYQASMLEEDLQQKSCNLMKKIEKLVNSNPQLALSNMNSFTWSRFNTLSMKFIKGVGIVAVLAFFIIRMKHKSSKKLKIN